MTTTTEPRLTAKQKRVLDLLEQDMTVPEIAKRMKIGPSGVHGHIRKLRQAGVTLPAERTNDSSPAGTTPTPNGAVADADEVVSYVSQAVSETNAKIAAIEDQVQETAAKLDELRQQREALAQRERRYHAMLNAA